MSGVVTFDPDKHRRRTVRLKGYDYSQPGACFVTVCSYRKAAILGEIQEGSVLLSKMGRVALDWWKRIPSKFGHVILDQYIVMPDHLHGIIKIVGADPRVRPGRMSDTFPDQGAHTGAPLPKIIQWFKTMSTNEYLRIVKQDRALDSSPKLWQRNYYEHIIRNETELAETRKYIKCNPLKLSLPGAVDGLA